MIARAVLFDLDGTLLDTLDDITDAANAVLEREGFPTHARDAFKQFIGDGVAMLFRRALPPDRVEETQVARCLEGFHEIYGQLWNARSRPYEGVVELLDSLTALGLKLGVLSNKPDAFTRQCVESYFARWPFQATFGERSGVPRKPDPAGALEIARILEIPPEHFLYVGDTPVDMQTACRAGMTAIGAAWGFRSESELRGAGATAIIHQPADLLKVQHLSEGR